MIVFGSTKQLCFVLSYTSQILTSAMIVSSGGCPLPRTRPFRVWFRAPVRQENGGDFRPMRSEGWSVGTRRPVDVSVKVLGVISMLFIYVSVLAVQNLRILHTQRSQPFGVE